MNDEICISDLILELEAKREEHGDLPVGVCIQSADVPVLPAPWLIDDRLVLRLGTDG
jgi:hypothetical protein